jgi:arylsulfatase
MSCDRLARINSDTAGRPVLIKGKSQILFGSMGRLSENSVLNLKNKSHSVTAVIEVPKTGLRASLSRRAATLAVGASARGVAS